MAAVHPAVVYRPPDTIVGEGQATSASGGGTCVLGAGSVPAAEVLLLFAIGALLVLVLPRGTKRAR